jgi:hypothetical protein
MTISELNDTPVVYRPELQTNNKIVFTVTTLLTDIDLVRRLTVKNEQVTN